jgi:hypothetical protein
VFAIFHSIFIQSRFRIWLAINRWRNVEFVMSKFSWAKLPAFSPDYSCRRKSLEVNMEFCYQFRTSRTLNDEALLSTYLIMHQRSPSTFFWQPGYFALCHGT